MHDKPAEWRQKLACRMVDFLHGSIMPTEVWQFEVGYGGVPLDLICFRHFAQV